MGTSCFLEVILGDDIVELITQECQSSDQVTFGLKAMMPSIPTLQLPTPPPSPPPSKARVVSQTKYQSPRWSKRFKLPQTILTTTQPGSSPHHAPIENVPSDILWQILSQKSTNSDRRMMDSHDHVALILSSKKMASKYFETFSRQTSLLEQRNLLTFDRIAAPAPRHFNTPVVIKRMVDAADIPGEGSRTQGTQKGKSKLKRPRTDDDEVVTVTVENEGDFAGNAVTKFVTDPKRRKT